MLMLMLMLMLNYRAHRRKLGSVGTRLTIQAFYFFFFPESFPTLCSHSKQRERSAQIVELSDSPSRSRLERSRSILVASRSF